MEFNQEISETRSNGCTPNNSMEADILQDEMTQPKRAHDHNEATEMEPQKKLCRYYYLDNCAKAESCVFMHSEFPCKFYYFGYECKDGNNCKLLHGCALNPEIKQALWDHVMSAPANLLQRFPCFPQVLLMKNFDDRHNELIQMEQEGLLENEPCTVNESVVNPVSSTLLSEVTKTQAANITYINQGELVEILAPEQIESLVRIGVETMEQLFRLGASLLLELGFDIDTINKIGNFKEIQRKKSIYTTEIEPESHDPNELSASDIFGSEILDESLSVLGNRPTLTDQELLSILNEDLNTSFPNDECSSNQDIEAPLFNVDSKIRTQIIDGCQKSQYETFTGFSKDNIDDISAESSGCILKVPSDADSKCHQLMLYPAVQELENDQKSLESIERTVHQLKKIDSQLTEEKKQDTSWISEESDVSTDCGPRPDSSLTDSINQSFGSDSDSQTCFRMPFKSIINRYTPAKEIDASIGMFLNTQYQLIPVEVPKPNLERIRRTFITAPTYSLDPRIQIMFNVGPKEVRRSDNSQLNIRDPRLKKSTEVNIGDVPENPA